MPNREQNDSSPADDVAFFRLGALIDLSMRDFDVTTLRLPGRRIEQVAEDIAGLPADTLEFHDVTPVSPAMSRYWNALMNFAASALMEHRVAAAVIIVGRGSGSHRRHRRAAHRTRR